GLQEGLEMETQANLGKITIAPEVLATTARLTALAVPGVCRLVSPPGVGRLLPNEGVKVKIVDDKVYVKVYVVTDPGVNMLAVGRKIRAEITRALQGMVGVEVEAVDVHIEDVGSP
ncbi:MAG: Asp23/Gls24 family envelope stress response protein, partial [Anaerolineae bacterium]